MAKRILVENLPTFEEIDRLVRYDPETGKIFRKVRTSNRTAAGAEVGCINAHGYLVGHLTGKLFGLHRVAWLLATGKWPLDQIDHVNGKRNDNRLVNLREASSLQNARNSKLRSDNSTGIKGVRRHRNKWTAFIKVAGKEKYLGVFATPSEAHEAYVNASNRHFGEFHRSL